MLDEDIEAQLPLISLDTQTETKTIIHRIKNIKKYNEIGLCDWIIGIVFVACIIATIVIIVRDQSG